MNCINYNNVNNVCFDKFVEMIVAKRVIYDVVTLLEQYHNKGAFLGKVVPLFTLINSYIVFTNSCFIILLSSVMYALILLTCAQKVITSILLE